MERGRSELDAKLRRFSARAESGSPASIARSEQRRASLQETFRSGWTRPPQVVPPAKSTERLHAERRSSSLPSERRGAGEPRRESRGNLLQLPWSQDSATSLADRVTSRSSSGHRTSSSSSLSGRWRFARELPGKELSHEGWLAKRSSGKISGRWQQRYFRLEGCYLRYMQSPSSSVKKTFNLRKAQTLSVAEDQPRELNLDFGHRCWRLRAADAGEARRWLVLLEAGRLMAGSADDGDASDSDADDLQSVCSVPSSNSTTAESFSSMEPLTPKFGAKGRAEKVHWRPAPPPIADTLEVNTQELDQKFDSWLPFTEEAMPPAPATLVCDGLTRALHALWLQLCEACAAALADEKLRLEASRTRPAVAAERAIAALLQGQSDTFAARESLETFLGEYLVRILRRLKHWLEMYDPPADEVAMIAQWLLFQAEPVLFPFCDRAESFAGEPLEHSKQTVLSIEQLLLREWESRSCEEASALCSYIFEGHYVEEAGRVNLAQLLRRLDDAVGAWRPWRSHDAACNRAASVLVATLNAALRSHHAASRALVMEAAKLRTSRRRTLPKMLDVGRQALQELQKVGSCKSDARDQKVSEELVAVAAEDAVQLATFCCSAVPLEGWAGAKKVCEEVLHAFAAAFESEASSLTSALAIIHHHHRRHALKIESFDTLLRKNAGNAGILPPATIREWARFLEGFSDVLQRRIGGSVVELLAFAWVQNFVRAPPQLSVWGNRLFIAFDADEAALTSLAPDSPELQKFVQLINIMRSFLQEGVPRRWQDLGKAERTLQELLAEDQGRALAQALWQSATR